MRLNVLKKITLTGAALVLTLPAFAQTTGTLDKVKQSGAITLAYRESSVPFSYLDDKAQPVGFGHEICLKIVDEVKKVTGRADLKVNLQAVTSANRIPLLQNGTIDIECGSTTNNSTRGKQVQFAINYFYTGTKFLVKTGTTVKSIEDLKGKTIVSTAGTTNIKGMTEINAAKNLGMNIISANGHPEAFQMVETGRAVAFVMDDILLYSLAAQSRNPKDYAISAEALSVEPYGIMMRRDDPAFKKVVDNAMVQTYKSGAISGIYDKRFQKPVPPRGINLNVPMSEQFKKVIKNPTDSGDPKDYQ